MEYQGQLQINYQHQLNGFEGYLTNGIYWRQYEVKKGVQRFEMENVYWYVSNVGITAEIPVD